MTLKVFLTALAIIDDLGAVVIIALFYTSSINALALCGALGVIAALIALNRSAVGKLPPYLVLGAMLWFLVLQSGAHATLAGVILALTIPLKKSPTQPDDMESPLHKLEHAIQPWVTFLIVPIFGFANEGVSFAGMSISQLTDPLPFGVAAGLFVGKQLGVFAASALVIRVVGQSCLCMLPGASCMGLPFSVALASPCHCSLDFWRFLTQRSCRTRSRSAFCLDRCFRRQPVRYCCDHLNPAWRAHLAPFR